MPRSYLRYKKGSNFNLPPPPHSLPPKPSIHSYVREKSGGVFLGRLLSFTEDIFIGHLTAASRLLL